MHKPFVCFDVKIILCIILIKWSIFSGGVACQASYSGLEKFDFRNGFLFILQNGMCIRCQICSIGLISIDCHGYGRFSMQFSSNQSLVILCTSYSINKESSLVTSDVIKPFLLFIHILIWVYVSLKFHQLWFIIASNGSLYNHRRTVALQSCLQSFNMKFMDVLDPDCPILQ